jgi:outer membrane immunogenic protein
MLVGGGVEQAITDNISARIEYRYSDLSDGDGKFDRHQALVGVAYRF